MLKKNKHSKIDDILSLASRLPHKKKQSARRKVLLGTIGVAGAAAAAIVGRAAKGRDPR